MSGRSERRRFLRERGALPDFGERDRRVVDEAGVELRAERAFGAGARDVWRNYRERGRAEAGGDDGLRGAGRGEGGGNSAGGAGGSEGGAGGSFQSGGADERDTVFDGAGHGAREAHGD